LSYTPAIGESESRVSRWQSQPTINSEWSPTRFHRYKFERGVRACQPR